MDKELSAIFGYLTLVAALIGVLAGLAITFFGLQEQAAARVAIFSMAMMLILFPLVLIGSIRDKEAYWVGLRAKNQAECIGKLMGSGLFGSLVALTVHMFLAVGIPSILAGGLSEITADSLAGVYGVLPMLGLAVITTLSGIAYLWLIPTDKTG